MAIEFTENEISTILTSIGFSKQQISDAQGTPYEVRQENLRKLDEVAEKLRNAKTK